MAQQGSDTDIVVAKEYTHAVESDDPAAGGAGANLVIADIALVIPHGVGIGVRKYHRPTRLGDRRSTRGGPRSRRLQRRGRVGTPVTNLTNLSKDRLGGEVTSPTRRRADAAG